MQRLLMAMSIAILGVTSCAVNQDGQVAGPVANQEEAVEANEVGLEPPGPLDDEWSRWLVGEWNVLAESDVPGYKGWVKGTGFMQAEMGLGGQFLVIRKEGRITTLSDEYREHLKRDLHASDEEIELLQSLTFGDIEFHSLDPRTGQVAAYLFDSWRCAAKGTGARQGNKEIIHWEWSLAGEGTSVRTTEKTGHDKFTITETYTLPDGSTMEDRVRVTRKQPVPTDSRDFAFMTTR